MIPTLKKEKRKKEKVIENQPKHLCHYRLGPAIPLCMENYLSVYKLQEETYLYRWRRGGETRAKLLGVSRLIFTSSENVFYVPFVSLYKQCVFVRVLASPVCLSFCCNPSLCVRSPPPTLSICVSVCTPSTSAFHFVSVTESLSICCLHFCSSVSYLDLPHVCLLLPEPGEAQARRRAHGSWFLGAASKWRHFGFHFSVSVSPPPPQCGRSLPLPLPTNQSIRTKCLCDGRRQSVSKQGIKR